MRSSFHLFSRGLYPNKLLYRSTVLKYTYIDDMKDHAMSETPNMESMHHIRAWTYCKKYIYYRCKIYAVFSEINIYIYLLRALFEKRHTRFHVSTQRWQRLQRSLVQAQGGSHQRGNQIFGRQRQISSDCILEQQHRKRGHRVNSAWIW